MITGARNMESLVDKCVIFIQKIFEKEFLFQNSINSICTIVITLHTKFVKAKFIEESLLYRYRGTCSAIGHFDQKKIPIFYLFFFKILYTIFSGYTKIRTIYI